MKFIAAGQIKRLQLNQPLRYIKFHQNISHEDSEPMFQDIKKHGQKRPVIIDQDRNLLDGYTRYDFLETLGIPEILYEQYHFEKESEKLAYIVSANRMRRHLSTYQKCQWAERVYEQAKKEAEKRQKKGTVASQDSKGKASEIAAKAAGVSSKTFERYIAIAVSPARVNKQRELESGTTTIKTAYNQITRKERNLPKAKMPKGEFDVILCDAPIGFNDKGGRGAAENHYSTMTVEQLVRLDIPTPKNAIIFFWMSPSIMYSTTDLEISAVTNEGKEIKARLPVPNYKAILDAWGFETVKGEFVWDKEMIGVGSWNRNQHENCLIGIKGNMPVPAELFSSIIKERRTQHSKKPQSIYNKIEKMYPKRNYLELFARSKRKGWKAFGNQLKEIKTLA